MKPTHISKLFDEFLAKKNLRFEAVIVGGSALALQNLIERETVDIDCLDPSIPSDVIAAAEEFRISHPELLLIKNWINNGPEGLLRDLPKEWRLKIVPIFSGKAIKFFSLGREDLLKTKLYAFCDRGDDFKDCVALNPTAIELLNAIEWVIEREANQDWPEHVKGQFDRLRKALKHD